MVIKEYRCSTCNRIFDSAIPACIHCGSVTVTRIFTTPFAYKSDKTKSADNHLEHLTSSYGLTDFSNNESTKHAPVSSGNWANLNGNDVRGLLPSMQGGSVNVDKMKGSMPGKYQATVHADDMKGAA